MPVYLTKKFDFEAAHFLPAFPEGHKCRRMHGHSFKVEMKLKGEIDPKLGILIDFADKIVSVSRPDTYDRGLVHAIESVIIEWTHQIRDVLKGAPQAHGFPVLTVRAADGPHPAVIALGGNKG